MGVFSALLRRITEFIEVFKRKEDIFRIVGDASPIGIYKAGATLEQLAKKYGYSEHNKIAQYICIYKNREEILKMIGTHGYHVSFSRALKVLRELKQKKGS
jgi:DNA-binding transcriptional ArsR family regulator